MEKTTMTTVKRILVATDFGESSAKAVALAIELANVLKAALTLIHVVEYLSALRVRVRGPRRPLSPARGRGRRRAREGTREDRARRPRRDRCPRDG